MALISKKKQVYPISEALRGFLRAYKKEADIPIYYEDLARFTGSISLYDRHDEDTLWLTVFYAESDREDIHRSLKQIYAWLKVDGNSRILDHLRVDRIDLCTYGNTRPFRVKIVNILNDNFDYFYVKTADASRVYGLELEDILSPSKVRYLVRGSTLIEEHIIGIPGDEFMKNYITHRTNKIRLAKEFIKFNERCLIRLLGDMHSSNFVVDITPDFEDVHYRIRAINFDQQCYEGRRAVYLPQYFKQNQKIIQVGMDVLDPATVRQYQQEERSLIVNRIRTSKHVLNDLLEAMQKDTLAPEANVRQLSEELAHHYQSDKFLKAKNMADLLTKSLQQLFKFNDGR